MRYLKICLAWLLLAVPSFAAADASDIPGSATWYFHLNLEQLRSEKAGTSLYAWMEKEIFTELKEESGVDFGKELDRLTAYSLSGQGPVFLFEGDVSQQSKDKIMTLIAVEGDLQPVKSAGETYYRLGNKGDDRDREMSFKSDNIEIDFDELQNESWVSLSLKNRIVVTSSEEQMKALLKNDGRIKGSRGHGDALVVLTAEKTLLQAGMNSAVLGSGDDGDSSWDSNILRNTEQVAFLVAAAANKLAIEAQLITTQPEMAESLASVVRGLISLASFNDDMDAEAIAMLQGTRVQAKGNSLSISLAVDPEILVSTLE